MDSDPNGKYIYSTYQLTTKVFSAVKIIILQHGTEIATRRPRVIAKHQTKIDSS